MLPQLSGSNQTPPNAPLWLASLSFAPFHTATPVTSRFGSAQAAIPHLAFNPVLTWIPRKSIGYPYGTIPRLLLFWMTTEVQHTKNRADITIIEKRTLQLELKHAHPGGGRAAT